MQVLSHLPGNIPLSCLNLLGTHDSCTAYVSHENVSRCQRMSIGEQLAAGVRLLDIRLCRRGGAFYLVHSLADCYTDSEKKHKMKFSDVLEICREFLKENPGETILLSIKQDRGLQSKNFFPAFYRDFVVGDDIWYTADQIPLLQEVRGKIVLLRRCRIRKKFALDNACGLDLSVWPDQKKKSDDSVTFCGSGGMTVTVQDRYTLEPKRKWSGCAKPALSAAKPDQNNIFIHFLSTSFLEGTLEPGAEYINGEFMRYELSGQRAHGWMLFDFPPRELCRKVIASNDILYSEEGAQI
ncbi:MAG: phosphatidylinositol-specific phospholipase C domain-containing protein [Acutalibacteraceae bacterium]